MRSAIIIGLAGPELSSRERDFLRDVRPAGIILFSRNCCSADQIRKLTEDATGAIGSSQSLVLIDQEGGRVQRLRPPLGRALPSGKMYGELFALNPDEAVSVARQVFRLLADDLKALGINCDCAPVLDIPVPGADGIIGDRAFGDEPSVVSALGKAVGEGLIAGGVVPVIKHIPGHGRAGCDSHLALPVVEDSWPALCETDFAPFKALADMPAAMTAHVVYAAVDETQPATTSRAVIDGVIRKAIGFGGLLMSDDLSMKALSGGMRARAEAAIGAGCDLVLHCNGDFEEMQAAAAGVPALTGQAFSRFGAAAEIVHRSDAFDAQEARLSLERLMAASCA